MKLYKNPLQDYNVVMREEWRAEPALTDQLVPLQTPVPYVVISWANTRPCTCPEACQTVVRQLQQDCLQRGLPDVEYNFMIGGDGLLYEGRGWDFESTEFPSTMKRAEKLNGHSIQIAFLDESSNKLKKKQLKAVTNVVKMGLKETLLSKKFKFYYCSEGKCVYLHSHDVNKEEKKMAKNVENAANEEHQENIETVEKSD